MHIFTTYIITLSQYANVLFTNMTVIQNSNVVSFWRQTDTSQNKLYYVAYVLHD